MTSEAGLRFIDYLSPGIPALFFEAVVREVQERVGIPIELLVENGASGPARTGTDPLWTGGADVGFTCALPYLRLGNGGKPPLELLGVAPVFRDERNEGRPIYFSDVIVHRDSSVHDFAGLRGATWAYNETSSLSGYHSLLKKLDDMGESEDFFGRMVGAGSHLHSIEAVLAREADAAAIDSNTLSIRLRESLRIRESVRVVESWGPFPVQPVVVRSDLEEKVKAGLRNAFLDVGRSVPELFAFSHFAPVTEEHYEEERRFLLMSEGNPNRSEPKDPPAPKATE